MKPNAQTVGASSRGRARRSIRLGKQVGIQEHSARARLAIVQGDIGMALESMRITAEMEAGTEKNPVTPGSVLPAREFYRQLVENCPSPTVNLPQLEHALAFLEAIG